MFPLNQHFYLFVMLFNFSFMKRSIITIRCNQRINNINLTEIHLIFIMPSVHRFIACFGFLNHLSTNVVEVIVLFDYVDVHAIQIKIIAVFYLQLLCSFLLLYQNNYLLIQYLLLFCHFEVIYTPHSQFLKME